MTTDQPDVAALTEDERGLLAGAWHDKTCPEGRECRSRTLHIIAAPDWFLRGMFDEAVEAIIAARLASEGEILDAAADEVEELRKRVTDYESAISWHTTCLNCSKVLDRSYQSYAEGYEAGRAEVTAAVEALVDEGDVALQRKTLLWAGDEMKSAAEHSKSTHRRRALDWAAEWLVRAALAAAPTSATFHVDAGRDALLAMADEIDRGPTIPLPPSVISALIRERAEAAGDDHA